MEDQKSTDFNKNDKQIYFNRVRGVVQELDLSGEWCSVTLNVGHENQRLVNFCIKKNNWNKLPKQPKVGDKIGIRFFLTSRFKNRWHTTANILEIEF